jgi:arylsulfatase A-like enzyme
MTGRYPHKLGYAGMPEVDAILPLNESTMAQEFQQLGCKRFKRDGDRYVERNM